MVIEDIDLPALNRSILTIDTVNDDLNSYLIPELFGPDELEAYLERSWIMLFELQLSGWIVDESVWRKKKSRKMFNDCFELKFGSIVFDLWSKDPLEYQDY